MIIVVKNEEKVKNYDDFPVFAEFDLVPTFFEHAVSKVDDQNVLRKTVVEVEHRGPGADDA